MKGYQKMTYEDYIKTPLYIPIDIMYKYSEERLIDIAKRGRAIYIITKDGKKEKYVKPIAEKNIELYKFKITKKNMHSNSLIFNMGEEYNDKLTSSVDHIDICIENWSSYKQKTTKNDMHSNSLIFNIGEEYNDKLTYDVDRINRHYDYFHKIKCKCRLDKPIEIESSVINCCSIINSIDSSTKSKNSLIC